MSQPVLASRWRHCVPADFAISNLNPLNGGLIALPESPAGFQLSFAFNAAPPGTALGAGLGFRVPTNARVSLGRLAVTMATAGAASSAFSVQDFQLDGQSVIGENIIDNAPKIGDQIHLWGIKDPALRATSG